MYKGQVSPPVFGPTEGGLGGAGYRMVSFFHLHREVTLSACYLRANGAGNKPVVVVLVQDKILSDAAHIGAGHKEG